MSGLHIPAGGQSMRGVPERSVGSGASPLHETIARSLHACQSRGRQMERKEATAVDRRVYLSEPLHGHADGTWRLQSGSHPHPLQLHDIGHTLRKTPPPALLLLRGAALARKRDRHAAAHRCRSPTRRADTQSGGRRPNGTATARTLRTLRGDRVSRPAGRGRNKHATVGSLIQRRALGMV